MYFVSMKKLLDTNDVLNNHQLVLQFLYLQMSKSKSWVQKALTVAEELSPDARKLLDDTPQGRSIDTAYAIATVPAPHQAAVTTRVVAEALTRQDVRRITREAKQAAGSPSRARGGRPSKTKPYQKTLRVNKGVTVTVKFRKSRVSDDEVAAALQQAAQSYVASKAA